jgi:CDP-4-dehydro-6-deoxyglucose reductase
LQRIIDDYPDFGGFDIYAAGSESLLDAARKWLLGHGLPEAQLIAGVVR